MGIMKDVEAAEAAGPVDIEDLRDRVDEAEATADVLRGALAESHKAIFDLLDAVICWEFTESNANGPISFNDGQGECHCECGSCTAVKRARSRAIFTSGLPWPKRIS